VRTADTPALPISVGGIVFNVPPAAIRVPLQRHAGPQARLDLTFLWPELVPTPPAFKPTLSEEPKPLSQLFISIADAQGTMTAEQRFKSIYRRYTASVTFEGPAGLIGVAFRDGTPYQGEDLFFEPERPDHFLVRCTRDLAPTAGSCLLERHIGAAELTARFPREWLPDWQKLADGVERLIVGLRSSNGS
jgi:hypothetical protein